MFDVTDFGAVPDDDRHDRDAIAAAVDAAAAAGGGVVFFPPGRFVIVDRPGLTRLVEVRSSDIVFRGSGAGPGGTELYVGHPTAPAEPGRGWTNPDAITFAPPGVGGSSSRRILEADGHPAAALIRDAGRGGLTLTVDDAAGFAPGDTVALAVESPTVNRQMLGGRPPRRVWERINTTGVVVNELHRVTAVDGNTLRLRAPLLVDARVDDGWRVIRRPMLERVGVEDLHFVGSFLEPFVHHQSPEMNGGWKGVTLQSCRDSWIRRCRFSNLSSAATLNANLNSSILDCAITGNGGHSGFNVSFGTRNLLGRCEDTAGTYHGPKVSHLAGGTVVWRCHGRAARGGPDFHGTFPYATLIDASSATELNSSGGNFKDLPNHLGGLVFWNFVAAETPDLAPGGTLDFWDLMPGRPDEKYGPLTAVDPLLVGLRAPGVRGVRHGQLIAPGRAVEPESLYEHQLERRLGHRPAWLDAGP